MIDRIEEWIKSTKVWQTRILPWLKMKIESSEAEIARLEAKRDKLNDQ